MTSTGSVGVGVDWVSCEFIALMVLFLLLWIKKTKQKKTCMAKMLHLTHKQFCSSSFIGITVTHVLPGCGCARAASEGILAASTCAGPLFLFCHLFVVLLSVCPSVCLSDWSRPRFICIPPTHPYSWWKRVTPRGDASVSVCRCVCVFGI